MGAFRRIRGAAPVDVGVPYYAAGTEFYDPGTARGRGQPSAGQVLFDIGGVVYDPNRGTRAQLRMVPDIFDQTDPDSVRSMLPDEMSDDIAERIADDSPRRGEIRDAIEDFMETHTQMESQKRQRLLDDLDEGGRFELTVDGQTYDLLDPNEPVPDFVPERGPDEGLTDYFTRVQDQVLEEYNAQYTVGQNFRQADLPIMKNLYGRAGREVPRVFRDENIIDLLDIARAHGPNKLTTMDTSSLGAVTAHLFDMTESQFAEARANFQHFQDAFHNQLSAVSEEGASHADLPEDVRSRAVSEALDEVEGRMGGMTAGQEDFFRTLGQDVHKMPEQFNLHTARMDAIMTGFAGRRMAERLDSAEMKIATSRGFDVLEALNTGTEERGVIERHGERGRFEDREENPFFMNQESATMGSSSLIDMRVLPFSRLTNPARQLYQRTKPRELMHSPHQPRETRDMEFLKQDRFQGIRNEAGGTQVRAAARAGGAAISQQLRGVHENDSIHRQVITPGQADPQQIEGPAPVHAGAGMITPKGRAIRGGRPEAFGVTTTVQMVQRKAPDVYGSHAQITPAVRDALMNQPETRQTRTELNMRPLREGMDSWMQDVAGAMEIEGPQEMDARVRETVEEIYQLSKLREKTLAQETATDETRRILNHSIEERVRRLQESGVADEARIQEAIEMARSGADEGAGPAVVGDRAHLFQPGGEGIVKDPLVGPANDRAVGMDIGIERRPDDPNRLVLSWIEDPGDIRKVQSMIGAKFGAYGAMPDPMADDFGSQAVVPAPFEKLKRRELSSYATTQIGRIHRRINEELQLVASQYQGDPAAFNREAEELLDRWAYRRDHVPGGAGHTGSLPRRDLPPHARAGGDGDPVARAVARRGHKSVRERSGRRRHSQDAARPAGVRRAFRRQPRRPEPGGPQPGEPLGLLQKPRPRRPRGELPRDRRP